ncbi:MAG TPA: gamma-glutamyl-gamma-aminobutyrate hydrolase family protein [Actinomycetes bacterium]|nr:gamma-glutamyl-gamma-aminobutyrate hydrolase family protein [Actinomycetes bacterium]
MKALVIANRGDDDAGHVGERLQQRGFDLQIFHRDGEGEIALDGVDLLVMLGSDWSVYWEKVANHVERESAAVRAAVDADTPVLGICYGGQLMSQALGGSTERAEIVEIGWFEIDSDDHELAPTGPWFEYHVDKFTPPDDAEVLASTAAGPQAYRLGRMLALQFHPEVSTEIIRRWGSDATADAEEHGVDLEVLYRQSEQLAEQNLTRSHALVDAFLDKVAFPSR